MEIVSLFLMYLMRLCGTMNRWGDLRRNNPTAYRTARKLQGSHMKTVKRELDVRFLKECLREEVMPKFTRAKTFKNFSPKKRLYEQKRLLRHALNFAEEKFRSLKKLSKSIEDTLRCTTSTMTFALIIALIKFDENALSSQTLVIHKKKMSFLIAEKKRRDGLEMNPNKLVINLTNYELNAEELNVLKLGLNYSIALRPKEPRILTEVETLWDQIVKKGLLKDRKLEARVKTTLRAFAFSYLDIDDLRFSKDSNQIQILKKLRKNFAILKPDKGNGIVLINKPDYVLCMQSIFDDRDKFREVKTDNSTTLVKSLQNYLCTLESRFEISSEEKSDMRSMSGVVARAHGLPKIHKKFDLLPKFRPIIDTTGTAYSHVGRFLSTLLQPLTINDYSLKDSFEAAERINLIPKELLNDGYKLISFDVVSLFTNVPLLYTVNIILDRIFNDNLINTNLSKRTLKKLILDSCRKTIFSFNGKLYKQVDGVSMGSSLGPVLANIIMTELESRIIKPLIDKGIIKFYCRYVDDTLVLIKPENIDYVHNLINNFHPNLKFIVDTFKDSSIHFLDLLILDNLDIDIYRKDTFTGQYINFSSFTPWHYKVSWVRSLIYRCKTICSNSNLFNGQIQYVTKLMAWNDFPLRVRHSLCNKFRKETKKENRAEVEKPTLWLNLPFLGKNGHFLVRNLERKLHKSLGDFKLRMVYRTNKLSMFCSNKDRLDPIKKANVVYCFTCPGCAKKYIGKTERNLITRVEEHARGKKVDDSAIHSHLESCTNFNEYLNLYKLFYGDINLFSHYKITIMENTSVLDSETNWLKLLFLEAYFIKRFQPSLNTGVKASRELQLF